MRLYIRLLLVFAVMFCGGQAYTAFPVHASEEVSVRTEKRSFDEFINATIEKYNLPAPPYNGDGSDSPALSIASLGLAIGGLAAIVVAIASLMWVLLIPAGLMGITAIILGAMGSRRQPLRGLGIAGFALGIVDLSVLLVIGFFALLFAAFTGM